MAKIFRKPRIGTIVFYIVVVLLIGVFAHILAEAQDNLTAYLKKYQDSHINTQYQKVFHQLFDDPDWGALYDMAGIQDTEYEGKQAFVQYMEEKVGDAKLTCFIESNGTSGKKCPVYLGDEEIGIFYMESAPEAVTSTADPWYYDIPFVETVIGALKLQSWHQSGLVLHYQREEGVRVCTEWDRIVYVNGVPLSQEQIISTSTAEVENYLPDGLHGPRRQVFYQEGFLVPPEVTVTDLEGNPVELVQQAPGQYTEVFPQDTLSQELETWVVEAGQAYCRYMGKAATIRAVSKYFDQDSDTYHSISNSELWMNAYHEYYFAPPVVSEYCRYSEDFFSARLTMSMFVIRSNGTEREYPVDVTFLVREYPDGTRKVCEMTNVDVQKTTTMVRLRFFVGDELVDDRMVDSQANSLVLPQVEAPEGKTFTGWYQYVDNGDGSKTLQLMFLPQDGSATVYLPQDVQLSAMTLHARFE